MGNARRWALTFVVVSIGWATLALHGWRGDVRMDQAIGLWILHHGRLPSRNHWTVAALNHSFSDTEWLYAVMVALVGRWGIFILSGLVWTALATWIVRWLDRWPWPWSGLAAVGWALLMMPLIPPRPELWSYLGWWGTLMALMAYREHRRTLGLWMMAGMTLVWAQMHRSAWLVVAVFTWELLLGDPTRRKGLWGPALLSLVAIMLPPAGGITGLTFLVHVGNPHSEGVLNTVTEWLPPNVRSAWGLTLLGIVCGVWGSLAGWLWHRHDRVGLGWLVLGTMAAMEATRLAPYALLGWLVLATPRMGSVRTAQLPRWWNGVAAGAGLWIAIAPWLMVMKAGIFQPSWPPAALLALRRAGATTNILAYQGDTLVGSNIRPWVDGQVQMVDTEPWWPAWIDTEQGRWSPAAFVTRWDPSAQAIVWPTLRPGLPALTLPKPWRPIWHGPIRWVGTQPTPTTIWVRSKGR